MLSVQNTDRAPHFEDFLCMAPQSGVPSSCIFSVLAADRCMQLNKMAL